MAARGKNFITEKKIFVETNFFNILMFQSVVNFVYLSIKIQRCETNFDKEVYVAVSIGCQSHCKIAFIIHVLHVITYHLCSCPFLQVKVFSNITISFYTIDSGCNSFILQHLYLYITRDSDNQVEHPT